VLDSAEKSKANSQIIFVNRFF